MNFYIFENLYGEKPHRDETKWNRDAALNSYNIISIILVKEKYKIMEFTSFATLVRDEVERNLRISRTGEKYIVRINKVMKNNGVVLSGITLIHEDSKISPTIYLNNYYEAYEKGQTTLKTIVKEVVDTYDRNKVSRSVNISAFMDYEKIKGRIIYKLINTERNRELLSDVPSIAFHDLSIVFQCLVSEEKFGNATIMIHNAHLKIWNITVQELYEAACVNTPKLQKYDIKNMRDIINEMISDDMQYDELYCDDNADEQLPMYVLSNQTRVQGASCMLYPDILKDFSTALNRDIFILPSSIHELILLPVMGDENCDELKSMVVDINETQVEREEVLSDSVYYYDRTEECIKML